MKQRLKEERFGKGWERRIMQREIKDESLS